MSLAEGPRFSPITADCHRTPGAGVVLGSVEEGPTAIVAAAGLESSPGSSPHRLGDDRQQPPVRPVHALAARHQAGSSVRKKAKSQIGSLDRLVKHRRRLGIELAPGVGVEKSPQSFAQGARALQILLARRRSFLGQSVRDEPGDKRRGYRARPIPTPRRRCSRTLERSRVRQVLRSLHNHHTRLTSYVTTNIITPVSHVTGRLRCLEC